MGIKNHFRAKAVNVKTGWVFGEYSELNKTISWINFDGKIRSVAIQPDTVGQAVYVNNEGHYIFEGDISGGGWVIRYVDGVTQAPLAYRLNIGWYLESENFNHYSVLSVGDIPKIIGNIHDNLELTSMAEKFGIEAAKEVYYKKQGDV